MPTSTATADSWARGRQCAYVVIVMTGVECPSLFDTMCTAFAALTAFANAYLTLSLAEPIEVATLPAISAFVEAPQQGQGRIGGGEQDDRSAVLCSADARARRCLRCRPGVSGEIES